LRFRIVNGAADQMVFAVLERNHIAIRGVSENLEHFAGKHPVVSMQNSRTRLDDNSGDRSSTPTLNYFIILSEVEKGAAGEAGGHRRKAEG